MSEKTFVENFWAKIEQDGGFKRGELTLFMARQSTGKSTFATDLAVQLIREEDTHATLVNVEVLKKRDYNGEQLTFDFDKPLTTQND